MPQVPRTSGLDDSRRLLLRFEPIRWWYTGGCSPCSRVPRRVHGPGSLGGADEVPRPERGSLYGTGDESPGEDVRESHYAVLFGVGAEVYSLGVAGSMIGLGLRERVGGTPQEPRRLLR